MISCTQLEDTMPLFRYWFNEPQGRVYCLVEAPTREAAIAVHREAHGLEADHVTEVWEGA